MQDIKIGIYRHFSGGTVLVYAISKYSEDDSMLVNYIGLQNKQLCSRPVSSFLGTKVIDGIEKPRFELVKEIQNINLEEYLGNYTSEYQK